MEAFYVRCLQKGLPLHLLRPTNIRTPSGWPDVDDIALSIINQCVQVEVNGRRLSIVSEPSGYEYQPMLNLERVLSRLTSLTLRLGRPTRGTN